VSLPTNLDSKTVLSNAELAPTAAAQRPEKFRFDIASGVLESLGLNMYTSIGKSLSEFVANAYDAEATLVTVSIPFEDIDRERAALRERAKLEVANKIREKFTVLTDPLPDTVIITVKDNGHGMSPEDIENKFLIINRNRRTESSQSETGTRSVMGRKGLGKLAGFGTAEKIIIRSKRAGETFSTAFTMDYGIIKKQEKVHESEFAANYEDNLPVDEHWTHIELSGLRCDSLKASEETVRETLAQNFAIFGQTFAIELNTKIVKETPAEFEFIYPSTDKRDKDGFGTSTVNVNEMFSFDIRYFARFRARESVEINTPTTSAASPSLKRGSLPTQLRGARIYCSGRLAAGPSLLRLQTGMHNFHAQAYMECVVHADEIDKQAIDFIGTNRADLKGDSDVVEALRDAVTEIMRLALYEHSKFRKQLAVEEVNNDEFTKGLLTRLEGVSKDLQASTKKLLYTLATTEGVKSEMYKTAAPLVLESMNAGEVLSNLIRLESDPKSLVVLAHELLELTRIENRDVIKLYRGRRNGIEALRKLVEQTRANWKKGQRFERDLHSLLKAQPWLIKSEFSRYLTSDRPLGDVAKELSSHLKIDEAAKEPELDADENIKNEDDRPDLVFAMSDSQSPTLVTVVELKTPNYPLRIEHLNQLEGYMLTVKEWLAGKYSGSVAVKGYLIGDTDPASMSTQVRLLNDKRKNAGPLSDWEIISLPELLERTKKTHLAAIEALEKDEAFLGSELSTDRAI
jgi:hypothetical protein